MTRRSSKRKSSKRRSSKAPRRELRANYTPPGRGFKMEPREGDIDEESGELTLRGQIRQEMIQKLASEWNQVYGRMEERSFRPDEEREAEADYLADQAKEYADRKVEELQSHESEEFSDEKVSQLERKFMDEFYEDVREKGDVDPERLSVIEELLSELGGRMMRPYEHWNEEEQYREWAERDRGDDY